MNKTFLLNGFLRWIAMALLLFAMMSFVASHLEKKIQKAFSQAENKHPTTELIQENSR